MDKEKEIKQVETEHLKVKGKVEEVIIHAYSMLAIKVGTIILLIITFILFIIEY